MDAFRALKPRARALAKALAIDAANYFPDEPARKAMDALNARSSRKAVATAVEGVYEQAAADIFQDMNAYRTASLS